MTYFIFVYTLIEYNWNIPYQLNIISFFPSITWKDELISNNLFQKEPLVFRPEDNYILSLVYIHMLPVPKEYVYNC